MAHPRRRTGPYVALALALALALVLARVAGIAMGSITPQTMPGAAVVEP